MEHGPEFTRRQSYTGSLLVATPLIGDPSFERTVVLLMEHSIDGAFGVVLNRPSETPATDVAPEWSDTVAAPGVLFVGGPVDRTSVLGLGRAVDASVGLDCAVVGDCAPVDLHRSPEENLASGAAWSQVRLFAGSASWASLQLEDELDEGAWWVVPAVADDVMTSDPDRLWSEVLRRQPGEVAWFAHHPDDPSAN